MTIYEYPQEFLPLDEREKYFQEQMDSIPILKYKVPFFTLSNWPKEKIDYKYIMKISQNTDGIIFSSLNNFEQLITFCNQSPNIKMALCKEPTAENIKYAIANFLSDIISRYMNCYKVDDSSKDEIINRLIAMKMIRYFEDNLPIKICIPICFITFESDSIELVPHIYIKKIPYSFQKSRVKACHFESHIEENASCCATHMLVLDNYNIPNKDLDSVNNVTRNASSFPLDIIDNFFASVRICTGLSTGYGAIICEPQNWVDNWYADLDPLYGTTYRAINPNSLKDNWLALDISPISKTQIKDIINTFIFLSELKIDKKHANYRKLKVSVERLNRCLLREAIDDTALDAIIGIEMLLSGNTQGEITYTISNRISLLAYFIPECPYSSHEMRLAMRKIYNYRSAIVHGKELKDKETIINIKDSTFHVKDLAIEFLRYSIIFMINHPEYLDATKLDEEIDKAIDKYANNKQI